jgi:hypothetical protein
MTTMGKIYSDERMDQERKAKLLLVLVHRYLCVCLTSENKINFGKKLKVVPTSSSTERVSASTRPSSRGGRATPITTTTTTTRSSSSHISGKGISHIRCIVWI